MSTASTSPSRGRRTPLRSPWSGHRCWRPRRRTWRTHRSRCTPLPRVDLRQENMRSGGQWCRSMQLQWTALYAKSACTDAWTTPIGFLGQCPTAPQPRRGSDRACVQGGAGWCMLRCRLRGYKSTPGCASAVVSSGKAFRAGEGSYCLQIPAGPSPPCALARVQGPPPSKCSFD